MTTSPEKAYDFVLVNAFSTSTFGGNPAAVIFLDAPLSMETFIKTAGLFNQPITCFVLPAEGKPLVTGEEDGSIPADATATFALRWFTPHREIPLCGHGTLATAFAMFRRPERVSETIQLLRFETMHGFFSARRAPGLGTRVEILIPEFVVKPVDDAEFAKVSKVVAKAFGRETVAIKFIGTGHGAEGSDMYVLIDVDEKEGLKGAKIDTAVFVSVDSALCLRLP